MTTPDPNGHQPIDLNKPANSAGVGQPYPSGYPLAPEYSSGFAQHPQYPETSGYPPMPEAPYPQATGPGYPATGSYPAAGYPPAAGYAPGYGQPPYGSGYPAPRNGLGTAALVLGIIAVVLSWTVWVGIILAILAISFGGVGLGRAKRGEATNRSSAMAGLVLGIVAIGLLVLLVIVGIGLYSSSTSFYG